MPFFPGGNMKAKKWYQSKTIWVAISAIVAAGGGLAIGEISAVVGIQTAVVLIAIFLREGVGNSIK
jgi:hypothetical protein